MIEKPFAVHPNSLQRSHPSRLTLTRRAHSIAHAPAIPPCATYLCRRRRADDDADEMRISLIIEKKRRRCGIQFARGVAGRSPVVSELKSGSFCFSFCALCSYQGHTHTHAETRALGLKCEKLKTEMLEKNFQTIARFGFSVRVAHQLPAALQPLPASDSATCNNLPVCDAIVQL